MVPIVAKEEIWDGWKCDDMVPNLCADLIVTKGTFVTRNKLKIHYWRYTSPNLDKDKFPIININGGPGASHDYDLPWKQLACRGWEIIFYDQGGTGESALPPNTTVADDYPFLLDATYYSTEELPALIKALDIKEYHIVSDSWGTMIAMQNVIEKPNANLLSLTLNGPIPKATDWTKISWDPVEGSIGTLPNYIKSRMLAIEKAGDFDSEEMQEIQMVVLANFYSRNGLFPDCASKSFFGTNEEIAVKMWGAIDFFNITGTLKDFDLWPDINDGAAFKDIPTLLISGEYDMVRPVTVDAMYERMPLSEKILLLGAGHASIFDDTEELLNAVDSFLDRVEFAETDEQIVFVPKRPGEEKETFSNAVLQFVVAGVVIFVTFILGVLVGKYRGGGQPNRSQYSEIS